MPFVPPMPPAATGPPMIERRRPTTPSSCSPTFRRGGSTWSRRWAYSQEGASAGPQPTGSNRRFAANAGTADWLPVKRLAVRWLPVGGLHSPSPVLVPVPPDDPCGYRHRRRQLGEQVQQWEPPQWTRSPTHIAAPTVDPVQHSPRKRVPSPRVHRCRPRRNRSSPVAPRRRRRRLDLQTGRDARRAARQRRGGGRPVKDAEQGSKRSPAR